MGIWILKIPIFMQYKCIDISKHCILRHRTFGLQGLVVARTVMNVYAKRKFRFLMC
jgi:hypothetical protein